MSKSDSQQNVPNKDKKETTELPKNPVKGGFSKFGSPKNVQNPEQEVENYSKDIHSKKNKVFRGVR